MNYQLFKQILLYGLQIPFTLIVFDIPGLDRIKGLFLKLIFKSIHSDILVRSHVMFVTSHASLNGIGNLNIGKNVLIKNHCELDYSGGLTIGNNVRIAKDVYIFTHGHDFKDGSYTAQKNNVEFSPLAIEDNVVIGTGVKILNSVNVIGEGSVISAGSVVIKDVPKRSIVMGNPARPFFKKKSLCSE